MSSMQLKALQRPVPCKGSHILTLKCVTDTLLLGPLPITSHQIQSPSQFPYNVFHGAVKVSRSITRVARYSNFGIRNLG